MCQQDCARFLCTADKPDQHVVRNNQRALHRMETSAILAKCLTTAAQCALVIAPYAGCANSARRAGINGLVDKRHLVSVEVVNSMCTQFNNYFAQIVVFLLMGPGLVLFLCRSLLIVRLKQLDIAAYKELGCPSFSDVFGTKAGRALLHFLWTAKFRVYEDKILVISAWLTIGMLLAGEVGLIGVFVVTAYCH